MSTIADHDHRGAFNTKKDKKKSKKGAIADPDPIVEVLPPPPPHTPVAHVDEKQEDEPWGGFMSTTKKDKKKKKANFWEAEPDPVVPEPEPVISPKEEKKEEEDIWSTFGTAKDKKKAKKAGKVKEEEKPIIEDPIVDFADPIVEAPAATTDDFDGWGMSSSKKVSLSCPWISMRYGVLTISFAGQKEEEIDFRLGRHGTRTCGRSSSSTSCRRGHHERDR